MSYKTILVENGTKKEIVLKEYGVRENTSGGSSSFTGLIDTPTTYSGQAGKVATVKGDEGGIEFTDLSTAGLQKVEDDTAPVLGGDLELGGFELTQASGNDFAIDVAGLATGDDFIIKSGASELLNLSFDSDTSEMLLDLSKSGLSTRIIGLPTNQTPISSEALSYQYLVDNGVLNPMVANLNAGKQSIVDTKMLFFGETDEPEASGFGIQAVSSGAIPAITSSKTAEFTTLDSENTIVIAPEIGQPIMVTGDGGASVTMTYPSLDGTAGQVLTTNGAGESNWADAAQDAPVDSVDGRTGVVTLDDLYLPKTKEPLIDSALQPGDNVSALANDAGYLTNADLPPGSVVSVDGRTGVVTLSDLYAPIVHTHVEADITDLDKYTVAEVDAALALKQDQATAFDGSYTSLTDVPTEFTPEVHTHFKADITDFSDADYATAAQGALADTAIQPLDNVSELTNDAGYITLGEVPADAVTSVDGRTGVVTLTDLYAPIVHTHVETDITDLDKYTQAEVDTNIAASLTTHVNSSDPHPQYLTPQDLPSTVVSWYTDDVSGVDGAFFQTLNIQPQTAESSIQATGTTEGVPVLLGQWLRDDAFPEAFELFETSTTFQVDVDCSNTNCELYIEFWQRAAGGGDTLLSSSDLIPLTSNRQSYTGQIITPGPISIGVGDRTFTRMYVNKNSGGADPTVTLYMEGNGVSRVVTSLPIATFPAPHAVTHEVGGTDQISHDNLLGANGHDSHATIDSKILALETNAFLDGDTIDNGTY